MSEARTIDLNADLGEYQNEAGRLREREILRLVTSCNIACGGHTGDARTMGETLRAAANTGVACGAHPSLPDRAGFGRVPVDLPLPLLANALKDQLTALKIAARKEGVPLRHLKPHGALYHQAMVVPTVAVLLAECMVYLEEGAMLVGLPGSALAQVAQVHGIGFCAEGFIDRRYLANGQLLPRDKPGALLATPEDCARQALQLAKAEPVETSDGPPVRLAVKTLCLHGDRSGAVEAAQAVRKKLLREQIILQPCHKGGKP